jgi:hypothetical protein
MHFEDILMIKNAQLKKATFFCAVAVLSLACNTEKSQTQFEENFYRKLENHLEQTKNQFEAYSSRIHADARSICADEIMTSFFKAKKQYYALARDTILPLTIVHSIEQLKRDIQNHYLNKYLNFYDILFVDTNGDIFYTIRKHKDYHKNIFKGALASTALSKYLHENPGEAFVDFQFYEISGETLGFFIEPVISENGIEGWFVLQWAVKKIDKLFEEEGYIGHTGEVILVNKDNYMLTNSRFRVNPTILEQKLPDSNISFKFEKGKGRKLVTDYRGKEAYSVFEVVTYMDEDWLIIVKEDKNEYFNEYYKAHKKTLYPELVLKLNPDTGRTDSVYSDSNLVNVDMDEWQRTEKGEVLFTQGVSTCTAIIASYPGKFSYMVHISPNDQIYGEERTDLLNRLLKQISYFEVTEFEKSKLQFYIVSTHDNSFSNSIDMILEDGYFLSQIKILYGKHYKYGNVIHDASLNRTFVDWRLPNNNFEFVSSDFANQPTLNKLLQ